jgi:hypothetical protein
MQSRNVRLDSYDLKCFPFSELAGRRPAIAKERRARPLAGPRDAGKQGFPRLPRHWLGRAAPRTALDRQRVSKREKWWRWPGRVRRDVRWIAGSKLRSRSRAASSDRALSLAKARHSTPNAAPGRARVRRHRPRWRRAIRSHHPLTRKGVAPRARWMILQPLSPRMSVQSGARAWLAKWRAATWFLRSGGTMLGNSLPGAGPNFV